MSSGYRVRILCEDRRSERFLTRLCESHQVEVLTVDVAPAGIGAASAWVLERYPDLVRQRRSKNYQHHLGLLVHVDGDNLGVAARKAALDARLVASPVPVRGVDERIALLVPTWCIETWLLHLSGIAQPPEDAKLKRDPDPTWRPALRQIESTETTSVRTAVSAWHTLVPAPSSLVDARVEARRIGIV